MYPNLYYAFSDLFGIEIPFFKLINSFGFFVAMAFVSAGYFLTKEFTRYTQLGSFPITYRDEVIGAPASIQEIISQSTIGFLFGWKFLYLGFNASSLFTDGALPQSFLFSFDGSIQLGVLGAIALGSWSWWGAKRKQLLEPKIKKTAILPHEHIGSVMTVAAVGGILGAKIFHFIEYPDQFIQFIQNPSLNAILGGLTIYGGLICGGLSVWLYCKKHNLHFLTLADATAPSLMLGYGVGRIGCQVSGDGDWGINIPYDQPQWLSWLPDWTWGYNFPNNVNRVGRAIKSTDPWTIFPDYGTCLDSAVFPTSLYETTMAVVIFSILWALRTRIKTTGVLFGIYLVFNGFERFWIEKIRVNTTFEMIGLEMTQAELISVLLATSGIALIVYLTRQEKVVIHPK